METCIKCEIQFHSRQELLAHNREVHQQEVQIGDTKDGSTLTLQRHTDGKFRCPYCAKSIQNALATWHHVKHCKVKEDKIATVWVNEEHLSDLWQNEELEALGLAINVAFGFLSCLQCGIALEHAFAGHLKKYHNIKKVSDGLASLITEKLALNQNRRDELQQGKAQQEPVEGLVLREGFACTKCVESHPCVTSSSKAMKEHYRLKHENKDFGFQKCFMQTLKKNALHKPFAVFYEMELNEPSSTAPLCNNVILQSMESVFSSLSVGVVENADDPKFMNYWVRANGFHQCLAKYALEPLRCEELVSLPEDTSKLATLLNAYLSHGLETLDACSNYIKRELMAFNAESRKNGKLFKKPQEQATITAYSRVILKFLYFLFRLEEETGPLHLGISDDIWILIRKLKEAVEDPNDEGVEALSNVLQIVFMQCGSFYGPSSQFLAFRFVEVSMTKTSGILRAENCLSILAPMIWMTRLVVLIELSKTKPEDLESITKTLAFVRYETKVTTFYTLVDLFNFSKACADKEATATVTWLDDDCKHMRVNDVSLSLAELITAVEKLFLEAEQQLGDLMFGQGLPAELESLKFENLFDDLNNISLGYSFLSDRRNGLQGFKPYLLQHLVKSSEAAKYVLEGSATNLRWNPRGQQQYFLMSKKFIRTLLALVHITSGQPCRATELETVTISNSAFGKRSLFLRKNRLVVIQTYNKTSSYLDSNVAIPRFLPERLSKLLLIYLCLVRPVEIYWASNPEQAKAYQHYLFVKDGAKMHAESIRLTFNAKFLSTTGKDLNFNEYRHCSIAYARQFIKEQDASRNLPVDQQAGHSVNTGETVYGRVNVSLSSEDEHRYFEVSKRWQNLLGITCSASAKPQNLSSGCSAIDQTTNRIDLTHLQNNISITNNFYNSSPEKSIMPSLLPAHDLDSADKLVKGLRLATNDANATFRSASQYQNLHMLYTCTSDLALVSPTGSGKTLMFIILSLIEDSVSVIVTPLTALKQDFLRRLQASNVSWCSWTPEVSSLDARLVVVSAELAITTKFLFFLQTLQEKGRLRRICIDECHLASTASEYRPHLRALVLLRTVSVPMVLVTATMPIKEQQSMCNLFSFTDDSFLTIRTCTARENISYSVVETQNPKDYLLQELARVLPDLIQHNTACVVFVPTRALAEQFRKQFTNHETAVDLYHSGLTLEQKLQVIEGFQSLKINLVFATSGFGAGLDCKNISRVYHYIGSYSLIEFSQESGRAGREIGSVGKSIVITSKGSRIIVDREKTVSNFWSWIDSPGCRRAALQQYLDGAGSPCFVVKGVQLCDRCAQLHQQKDQSVAEENQLRTTDSLSQAATPESHVVEDGSQGDGGDMLGDQVLYDGFNMADHISDTDEQEDESNRRRKQRRLSGSADSSQQRNATFSEDPVDDDDLEIFLEADKIQAALSLNANNVVSVSRTQHQKPFSSLSSSEAAAAAAIQTELTKYYREYLEVKRQKQCLLCLKLRANVQVHDNLNQCPTLHAACLRCMSTDHTVTNCAVRPPKGCCFKCWLPNCLTQDKPLHTSVFGEDECQFAECVRLLLFYFVRQGHVQELQMLLGTEESFTSMEALVKFMCTQPRDLIPPLMKAAVLVDHNLQCLPSQSAMCTPMESVAVATESNSRRFDINLRDTVKFYLSKLSDFKDSCLICSLNTKTKVASHSSCDQLKGLCLRCLGRHSVRYCTAAPHPKGAGICGRCGLVTAVGEYRLHYLDADCADKPYLSCKQCPNFAEQMRYFVLRFQNTSPNEFKKKFEKLIGKAQLQSSAHITNWLYETTEIYDTNANQPVRVQRLLLVFFMLKDLLD